MRTFSLKDDTCFSGIRIHPNDREVDGGGYINLTAPPVPSASRGRLIPAHGFVPVPAVGSASCPERSQRAGEIAVPREPLGGTVACLGLISTKIFASAAGVILSNATKNRGVLYSFSVNAVPYNRC